MRDTLILFFTTCLYVSAQWNYNGSYIYYNSGNVGIGTSTPSNVQGWDKVLDVRGAYHSKIIASTNNEELRMGMYAHVTGWVSWGVLLGLRAIITFTLMQIINLK